MNFNKYLIAASITVGILSGAAAQNNNNKSPVKTHQANKYNGSESWMINSAKQTQEMQKILALDDNQLKEVKKINDSHAREIEVAKKECGNDVMGFNSYVDRVSNARDAELKNVLTPTQFATFTSRKSDRNWLGMANFKYKSEDGDLKVENKKKTLKIKGINNNPPPEDWSVSNKNNITIDSVSITEGVVEGNNAKTPEKETYPAVENNDEAKANEPVEKVKPEYNNMYQGMNECEEVSAKPKSATVHKKTGASSKAKTTKSKSTAKASTKSKNHVASSKSAKKATTAKAGSTKKKKKPTESASVKKKYKVDTTAKIKPVLPDTSASSEMPMLPLDTTAGSEEMFMMPDTTATIIIVPDTSGIIDTTSSASTKTPNHFTERESKAKFTDEESKVKPTNRNKAKESDSQTKLKNENNKDKIEKNQNKVKNDDLKIKVNK